MSASKLIRSLFAALAVFTCSACWAAAPDFTVVDANGEPVSLSDFRGTPVVVNFWASWCPPCRQELPAFDKLASEYAGRVQFMMVDLTDGGSETVETASAFVAKNGYKFPVFYDVAYEGAEAYGIRSIPMTVVVDASGEVSGQQIGAMTESALRKMVEKAAAR